MITPADIENKDFSRVKRGYDMEESMISSI